MRLGGELFSEQNVGYPGSSQIAAASRNGKRFAFRQAVEKSSGDGPDKIVTERITVFDIEARKAVFLINIERLRGLASPAHASGIALSPGRYPVGGGFRGRYRRFSSAVTERPSPAVDKSPLRSSSSPKYVARMLKPTIARHLMEVNYPGTDERSSVFRRMEIGCDGLSPVSPAMYRRLVRTDDWFLL